MSPRRRKGKDKGGLNTIARRRAVTTQSNAAKKEAQVPGRSYARADCSMCLSSPPALVDAVRLPTGGTLLPCPPAKRLRHHARGQQQEERQQEEQQQEDKKPQEKTDMEEQLSCPFDTTISAVACNNGLCSAPPCDEDITSPTNTQQQPSARRVHENTNLEKNSRTTSASLTDAEGSSLFERVVRVSEFPEEECVLLNPAQDSTGIRCSLRASGLDRPPHCVVVGASTATSEALAGVAGNIPISVVKSTQLNYQDDLLAPAADTLSSTKKLLVLAESNKGEDSLQRLDELRIDQEKDGSESDVNDEAVGKNAPLLSGRSTQPRLLQTHQDPVQPSTPTPRLLLNACCSSGVRTPVAGSPLSMSSQASTNSVFSASPLTCCSSIGPSSLPATPSCWLSDEHSPHQTQKHATEATSPGAAARPEQQQDGSVLLWEFVSSSTPMRSSTAAVPASALPAERSPPCNEEEECATLVSAPCGSSSRLYSCGRPNIRGCRYRVAAGNHGKLNIPRTDPPLSEPAAPEHARGATCSRAFPFPADSAQAVGRAVAAATREYVDTAWDRRGQQSKGTPSGERAGQAVTQEEGQNSILVVKSSSSGRPFFLPETHRARRRTAALVGCDQHKAAPSRAAEKVRNNNTLVDSGGVNNEERRHAAEGCESVCNTLVRNNSPKSSSLPSPADGTVGVVATAPVSLPLQLPIPARAPRGKAHFGQLRQQQQNAMLLPQQATAAAGTVTRNSFLTAASAEGSTLGREMVAAGTEKVAEDYSGATEEAAEVQTTSTGEYDTENNKGLVLSALLGRAGSLMSTSEEAKEPEGTSRCRLQFPAEQRSFGNHGEAQQQQAAALSAMERAAARAKMEARAAAECAAVIDAAAAAARNAAAEAAAANQRSAGTAAGYYTEYPDLQRIIHDDYDLFCSTVPEAATFLECTASSSSSANSRELGGSSTSQHLWPQPPCQRGNNTAETEFLRTHTCHGNAEEVGGGPASYWPDVGRNSISRSSSGTATSVSRSSSHSRTSTTCTESYSNRSEVTALGGDARAVSLQGRNCSDRPDNPLCDLKQREDLDCVSRGNHECADMDCQSQRPATSETCRCFKWCDSDAEPPREGVDEGSCQCWATDALKSSRNCFSRSSSMGTEVTRYTLERRSSRCTRCWCSRSCSLTKCSSLASSPRSRLEHLQKPRGSCESLAGSSNTTLLSRAGAQQENPSLSLAAARDEDMSSSVAEQAESQEMQEAADTDEKQLEAEGRDSTKSTQETSTDEGNASQQSSSKEGSSGWLPQRENSTAAYPDELLKSAVATSERVTEETLKTNVSAAHPSPLEAAPALRSATERGFTAAAGRRVSTTDNKSRRHVVLGAGRFGKVVLGHHNRSGVLVAVKIIDKSRMRGAGSEKDELNFRQEIEMHRRLPAHRNIVTVHDVYEDRKNMYLVMELCDRVSLLDKLAEEGPLREDVARQIFLQILAAVKHCHDHHVVHRDLKPENVLFARRQQPADTGRQLFSVVDPRHKTAAGREDTGLKKPGEQGSSYVDQAENLSLRCNEQKAAKERGTATPDASDFGRQCHGVTSCASLQVHQRQTYSQALQQLSQDAQLRRETVLQQQHPDARRGSSTPGAPLFGPQVLEGARPTLLKNPQSSPEVGATRDKTSNLIGVASRCSCCRCCGQEEDGEREMRSNQLLSLHMWRRHDRQEPPTVKLIDFGAACSCIRGQLRGTACGTTHYLAPEVLTGNYYDGYASDAWSLGVILFTMLAAAPPFDGLTHSRLARQIVRGEYRMDGLVWWKVSADAKSLILRLLDVNPQTRITVNEAARHPWVMRALPSGLPSLFFENAHCLSSLAAAAGEPAQADGGCCLSLFEEDYS